MQLRKMITIVIPVVLTLIGVLAVSAKYVSILYEDPFIKIKKDQIEPLLEHTAKVNRVMFKKYKPEKYDNRAITMTINDTILLVELQTGLLTLGDEEIIHEKRDAREYFTKLMCRVNEFKRLDSLQKSVNAQYGQTLDIQAEVQEIGPGKKTAWSITIRPSDCQ